QVTEWNGMKQLRVLRIRKSTEADVLELSDFIKAAPEQPEDMYRFITDCANEIKDYDLRRLTTKLLVDNKDRLWYYPAASRNHHAEYAGLLWHMKRMIMSGKALCKIYDFLNEDLVVTGVIIHDMEKLNEIDASENGIASGYSMKGQLLGHIVQGVTMIDELCKELGIDEEKAIVLEHMILTHHYEPEFGSPKKPMFPEAEILHYLDVMDARMFDMEEALDGVGPGGFSERVRVLDNRRIYRPLFTSEEE
ncbi:MAG: HD domain-containing protein, partial [[Eubacterium] sulci]|nr:HD domain-containing protein [[Eubacterium] sulci]